MSPYTSWDDVPLILRIEDLARVLNVSTSTIRRELSRGTFRPLPLPRRGQTSPIVWAKEAVMREWGGLAMPPVGRRRPFARGRRLSQPVDARTEHRPAAPTTGR